MTDQREGRLTGIMDTIAKAGEAGADWSKLVRSASTSFGVSSKAAEGYLGDLAIRGWIRSRFGTVTLTDVGVRELKRRMA